VSLAELATAAGSVLLLVSLFLPWQSFNESGHYEQRGWSTAGLAGVFTLGLLVTLGWAGRIVRELAIGAAIFVLAAGVLTAAFPYTYDEVSAVRGHPDYHVAYVFHFEYGALLGFAGTALLLAFALGPFRPSRDGRVLVRLVPVLAALALVAFAVAPRFVFLFNLLDKTNQFASQSPFLTLSLLGAITVLLALRLVLRWFDRPGDHAEVVFLPLALLAITTLTVIHDAIVTTTAVNFGQIYGKGISWEGWVAIFLCLLLVACGGIARRGGYPAARTDGSASTTSLATSP
jgi:hypothetical protein